MVFDFRNKFVGLMHVSLVQFIPSCSFRYALEDFFVIYQPLILFISFISNFDKESFLRFLRLSDTIVLVGLLPLELISSSFCLGIQTLMGRIFAC